MGYFRPSQYTIENALREVGKIWWCLHREIIMWPKDHGSYIEINIETDNAKGHVSYDLYFNESGELTGLKTLVILYSSEIKMEENKMETVKCSK